MPIRPILLWSVALVCALATGCSIGAATQRLRRTVHRVHWPVRRPLRIAHLTDLHVGWGAPEHLLRQAVRQCRRSRPDLTVLTGDYLINSLEHLERLRRVLRRLPRPCIATLGNHDHKAGADEVQRVFTSQGIPVLRNESRQVRLRGERLTVVGIDDGCTGHDDAPRALASVPRGQRAIVLTHDPELADEVARHGDHLVLAGHTHGGQVYIPLLTTAYGLVRRRRYMTGWYTIQGGTRLYVNAGIGYASARVRFGAQPEIAIFHLVPCGTADAPASRSSSPRRTRSSSW
jgi:predicted MPP superfamily phosphohydrolase